MMYSVKQVAGEFSVSVTTVHRWINSGLIKAKQFGGLFRISPDEVARISSSGVPKDPNIKLIVSAKKDRTRRNAGGRRPWEK